MARDKLITIRIESEKRKAFGDLAKSQNTDTASLLYDFISGCLDGKIDIGIVTGKKQWIDKIDNQIGSDRIDKLETTTQRIDERVGQISKKLTDWVEAFSDRLNDCDQGLSHKIISLEHRLNALASQLDSQRIDSIDTDSQQIDDMEPLIKEALRLDRLDDQRLIDAIESRIEDTEKDESDYESDTSPIPTIGGNPDMEPVATVETADTVEAVTEKVESVYDNVEAVYEDEPVTGSIGPVTGDSSHLTNQLCEGMTIGNRQGLTNQQLHEKTRVPVSTIEKWKGKIKEGEKVKSTKYPKFFKQWTLNLDDSLWYEVD